MYANSPSSPATTQKNPYQVTDAFTMVHPITVVRGKNAEVWDSAGKRYIDFVGGIGVLNFGHCHPKIVGAIIDQAQKLTHYAYNAAGHEPYQQLMPKLCAALAIDESLAGMLTNSGAEAVENALKVVRMQTGKAGVIAFDGGFHGRTLATVNLNGKVNPYKKQHGTLLAGVYHIPYPSRDNGISAKTAQEALERLLAVEIDVGSIGAVIVEPVQGEGGFLALDDEFAKYLRDFCDKNDIALIFDEIQSGFGRTGAPFAFAGLGVVPDLIVLAKSIAGGLPLGAVIGKSRYMNGLNKGTLGGTYSGNVIACAAALAVLELMESQEVWQSAKRYETILCQRYERWKSQGVPWLGQMTGKGAMRGIRLENCDKASTSKSSGNHPQKAQAMDVLLKMTRDKGLLLMPSGKDRDIVRLLPPLTIEASVLEEGLAIFEQCLTALPAHL